MPEPLGPSNLAGIEHKNVNATRGKILNVSHRCLSLRASKSFLNSGEVVKMHDRNQVIYRRSGWCGNRTTANLVFSDALNCFYERHVFFRIMLVKSGNVRRSLVHHYKLSHCFSPCPSKACHPKTSGRLAAIFGMRGVWRRASPSQICSEILKGMSQPLRIMSA